MDYTEQENTARLRSGFGIVGASLTDQRETPIQSRLSQQDKLLSALADTLYQLENRLIPVTMAMASPESENVNNDTQVSGSQVTEALDRHNQSIIYMRNRVEVLLNNIEV